MLEIVKTEFGGFMLRPQFEYEFEHVEWERSSDAELYIFREVFKTAYKAKQAAMYNGYELCA